MTKRALASAGDCRWLPGITLVAILILGLWLRWQPLAAATDITGHVAADAREYVSLAEFFLDTDLSPPGNRFPGFPLLLAALFRVLPFQHDLILIVCTMILSIVALACTYCLADQLVGKWAALAVTAMAAIQRDLVGNAHRGLSEELALSSMLVMLMLYLRMRGRPIVSRSEYAILAALAGWLSLVRPDAAYVSIVLFVPLLLSERRRSGLGSALSMTLPILLLPLLLPRIGEYWMVGLGIQELDLRAGRMFTWMEFLLGHMPWGYMFNTEIHVSDWLIRFHTIADLAWIGTMSSLRTILALGEAIWGQLALATSAIGMVAYFRTRRDISLPLVVPLSLLPQWAMASLWSETDVFRYDSRVLPLMFIFVLIGVRSISDWLQPLVWRSAPVPSVSRWLPMGVLLLALSPVLIPGSLYAIVRPISDVLYQARTRYHPKVDQTHQRLVSIWTETAHGRMSLTTARVEIRKLLLEHEAYAPVHLALGILAKDRGRHGEATRHLEKALELVPMFAEAGVLLAEMHAIEGRNDRALDVLAGVEKNRPRYALTALVRATLSTHAGENRAAIAAYEDYLHLNLYHYQRAIDRLIRILHRNGEHAEATRAAQVLQPRLNLPESALTTALLWGYLSLDLVGLVLSKPEDDYVYYNLGGLHAASGDLGAARKSWEAMLQLMPNHEQTWINLCRLEVNQGHLEDAVRFLEQGLQQVPGSLQLQQERDRMLQFVVGRDSVPEYLRADITLPMTAFTF